MTSTKNSIIEFAKNLSTANSKSKISTQLKTYIKEIGLVERTISLYESFQLMEIVYRLWCPSGKSTSPETIVPNMNMALVALLFNENAMYSTFANECRYTLDWYLRTSKSKDEKLRRMDHYILSDLEGFLSADVIHLEKLMDVRLNISRRRYNIHYHWGWYPYDFLPYEELLLKIRNGVIDHYEIDKTISPEVQDLMVAIELKAIELE